MAVPKVSRKVAFSIILVLSLAAVFEGLSAATICWLGVQKRAQIYRTATLFAHQERRVPAIYDASYGLTLVDPELGWRPRPRGVAEAVQNVSAQGLRGTREYSLSPPPGVVRLAVFGDSLVFGFLTGDTDCWPAIVERSVPEVEVLNYGVLGYGLDQEYLRYRAEGRQFAPQGVVIGCTPGVLQRCLTVYGPFTADSIELDPLTKPRFLLEEQGGITLFPNPLKSREELEHAISRRQPILALGQHDGFYRPCVYENPLFDYSATVRLCCWVGSKLYKQLVNDYRLYKGGQLNPSSRAFRLGLAILDRFAADVHADGSTPIVVLWAEPASVERVRRGETPTYKTLREALEARRIVYLDTADAFAAASTDRWQNWFLDEIHYSPSGNRVVAEWLGPKIRELAAHNK
jgi:hypothetical protein